jgi:hypothetical protein
MCSVLPELLRRWPDADLPDATAGPHGRDVVATCPPMFKRTFMSEKSRRRSALQQVMRNILPEEKHINVLLDLTGPLGESPEYDRAAAIISATFLEYGLKKCIKTHLKPDPSDPDFTYLFSQDDAPYRDFGTLIRLARALAVIKPSDYEHLETIRRIRNAFAHSMDHSLSFDHPNVSGSIDSLIRR